MARRETKRRRRTGVMIVIASRRDEVVFKTLDDLRGAGEPVVLSLRGFDEKQDDIGVLIDSMIREIRQRHPRYTEMKPRQIKDVVTFHVSEVCTGHGGWIESRGYAEYWLT